MVYDPYSKDWVAVYCPVCKLKLGIKKKTEIKSFICETPLCSKTEHTFYPGKTKRPGKSQPWASYYDSKKRCGKACCDPEDIPDDPT